MQNNILIYGSSGSGKTTLLIKILKSIYKCYNYIYAFGQFSYELKTLLGEEYVFEHIEHDVLTMIIDFQRHNRWSKMFLVFDDVLYENLQHDKFFKSFFSGCRHDNITTCILIQNITGIPPSVRLNFKHLYCLTYDNAIIRYISERTVLSIREVRNLIDRNKNKTFFYYKFGTIREP